MPPAKPSRQWRNVRRLLVVRLDNLGDIVMLSPSLRTLKSALPQCSITLLASPNGSRMAPLLPWVDQVFAHKAVWQDLNGDIQQSRERELALVDLLKAECFDAAIIFTSFSQSPWPPAYVCHLAGIPLRLGQSKEFGGSLLSHRVMPPEDSGHQVDRNLHLLEQAGFTVTGSDLELEVPYMALERADKLLAEKGIGPGAPFIALSPGASCETRRYPAERFAAAARLLNQRSALPVVVIGGEQEAPLAKTIMTLVPKAAVSLAGRTSVPELAAVIRRSSLLVANHSGPMHIADAFGRPMVILFAGTEHRSQWRPRKAPSRLLGMPTACAPCYRFTCPYGHECLDIAPALVAEEGMAVLKASCHKDKERMFL